MKPSMDAILDEQVEVKTPILTDDKLDKSSHAACMCDILLCMASTLMEQKHYSEAKKCLDECEQAAGEHVDKRTQLFLRRSQAVMYNKFSSLEDYQAAVQDIDKALSFKEDVEYRTHKARLITRAHDNFNSEKQKVSNLLKATQFSIDKVQEKNIKREEMFLTNETDSALQFKVMTE